MSATGRIGIVLELITQAAIEGRKCPTDRFLSRASGYKVSGLSKALNALVDLGCIEYRRRGQWRVIYVPSVDRCTADHRDNLQPMVERAARIFDTTTKDIVSSSRFREHIRARWAIMLTASELGYPFCGIGRALNRDHSTVMYGVEKAYYFMGRDLAFRNRVVRLQSHFLPQAVAA
jgi:chromosomal replication initiation ATPase DnaA